MSSVPDSSNSPLPCPIHTLFPEILCHVLIFTVPPLKPETPSVPLTRPVIWGDRTGPWSLDAPWSLAQVCSTWRTIALAYAPLWSSFTLSTVSWGRQLRYLDLQLERAGTTTPLDVLFRFTGYDTFSERQAATKVLRKLVDRCTQWRSLHLEFHWQYSPPEPFKQLGSLPMLEEIIFCGRGTVGLERKWENVFVNIHTPNLRKVVFGDLGRRPSPHISISSWAQLWSYTASYPDPMTHTTCLSRALSLVDCDIDFWEDSRDMGVVSLPQLRRLVTTSTSFLPHLIAPALLDLHIHGGDSDLLPILPFLYRSKCAATLTRLTLFKCSVPASEVVGVLRETPALTTLAIDYLGPATETAMLGAALNVNSSSSSEVSISPRLTSLSWGDRNDTINRQAFVDMVESRFRGTTTVRLRFVGLYLGRIRIKGAGLRLQAFAKEGLDVVVMNLKRGKRVMAEGWRAH